MVLSEMRPPQLPEELTYQARLRAAAAGSVTEADVVDVVNGIVSRAKKGDKQAIEQLFSQVLGTNRTPTKITQNLVVSDVETGARMVKEAARPRLAKAE